jgi:hypothetical protein
LPISKILKLLLIPALFIFSATQEIQPSTNQQKVDALLQKSPKVKFHKKEIKEIYLAGPNKTFNACGAT